MSRFKLSREQRIEAQEILEQVCANDDTLEDLIYELIFLRNMEIKVSTTNAHGRDLVWPACDKSRLFAELTGRTSLRNEDLYHIKELGYTITVENSPKGEK